MILSTSFTRSEPDPQAWSFSYATPQRGSSECALAGDISRHHLFLASLLQPTSISAMPYSIARCTTQVRKGNDGRRPSASTFFSTDDSAPGGGRPGPDPQALRTFEKLGGFAAMARQLERHTTCQVVCDALMGMIFGVWGSKHEPRPIREKDVLAIKGNKESWLRCGDSVFDRFFSVTSKPLVSACLMKSL